MNGVLFQRLFLKKRSSQGEYAAISTNAGDIFGSPSDGRLTFPTVQSMSSTRDQKRVTHRFAIGAVGEAAFMTGLERNSDIV